ncbi:hypothetical protein F4810DRAFT_690548 [Camillea tinctor]|nr:hypothetical protein F4810DRAFT_690548 [Camillea tinctor]
MWFNRAAAVTTCLCLYSPFTTVSGSLFGRSNVDIKAALTNKNNQWAANTTFTFPEDSGFAAVTNRWTIFAPPTFSAVVSPATEADVIQSVKVAVSNNIPFLATGARHGYTTTLGTLQNGLEIDLGQLNSVHVDKSAGILTIGGGAQTSDILDPVYEAGFEIPIGSCSCTGMAGVTMGAGVGRSQGEYGFVIDSLISARFVTADGQVVEVSEDSNPELFWGIRGAGANFGIVTSASYKLHPQSNQGQVMNADFIFPAEMAPAYFDALQTYNGSFPPNLAVVSIINYNQDTASPQILANWVYYGPEDEGRQAMAPIFALNPPIVGVSVVPWNQLLNVAGFGVDLCEKNAIRNIHSANIKSFSASTYIEIFDKMATFYAAYPDAAMSIIQMETFPNQAAVAIPDDSTAYPWRDALGNMIIIFRWTDRQNKDLAEEANRLAHEIRHDFQATSGYPDLSVYINYAYGDESLEQKYGAEKLPRLIALKQKWDPNNVFGYNNPLPTEHGTMHMDPTLASSKISDSSKGRDEL